MDHCVPENQYRVSRPIYSNPELERDGGIKTRRHKSFTERLVDKWGSCSRSRALKTFKGVLPVFDWLPRYPIREWLAGDVISGISTGLVCSLQGLAYSLLVSVAPVYGLYSAFFPVLTYFLLGTSRHISVGPFPVTCLMVGSMVLTLAPDDHFPLPTNGTADWNVSLVDTEAMAARRIAVASTMTVLVGLIQVVMGLFQVGFLVCYLSDPLIGGFTTAVAVHVLVSQLKMVLSVPTDNHSGLFSVFYTLWDVVTNIQQSNAADLSAGLLTIAVVMVVKEVNAKYQHRIPVPIPIEVIVTVLAAGLSYAVDLKSRYGANIVRSIPRGFAAPRPPDTELFSELLGPSFSTAVVGYAVAISVAKVYGAKHDYAVDGNQELLAFGVSNVFCGCFSSFVASTALSRTAVQESTGGRSQSVLAAIVIANLKGMFLQVTHVPNLWRQSPADCFIWLATCGASVVLGLDVGLLVGLLFQLGTVVVRTQFPSCSTLGNIPGTNVYRDVKDYKHIAEVPGVRIFKCSSPVYFANVDYFKERLRVAVGFDAVRVFKKRSKALRKIRKLVAKGELKLKATESGLSPGMENKSFEGNQEDGGRNVEVEVPVDWTRELPVKVSVPKVDIHSLVLDFSAVSFLDVAAVKCLRLIIKEFLRIGVRVYVTSCDDQILRRMEAMVFFDELVTKDILFVSVHDAVLYIQSQASTPTDVISEQLSALQDKEPDPFDKDKDLTETSDNEHTSHVEDELPEPPGGKTRRPASQEPLAGKAMTTMRQAARQYSVARPLFSEDGFAEEHEKIYRQRKSLADHLRQYFTCNARRAKNTALSLLPIIGWVRIYQIKEWLLSDIVSGVSTGLVAVLQGLAYCLLASLPPWYGLFSAFFPVIVYFFLGTSRHISVGPFPVLCLMIGSVVTRLVPDQGPPMNITGFEGLTRDNQRVLVAASTSFLVGLMQLGMGLLQVGFVVVYLSDTLVSGFTTAAAIHILVSQLKFILGLETLEKIFVQIASTNICDLVTSILIMAVVFVVKEINNRYKAKLPVPIPVEVIVTVIACGVSYGFDFRTRFKVDVVGYIPLGYEAPMAPDIQIFRETAVEAFPMAIVGFAVAFSVAKVYSVKHDYAIDGNQELIAFGVSNIFGASFKSFAASTALSRSAVQESTGGKTQVAGLLSAVIVMIVTLAIGFLLEPLPRAVLGAVVIVNLKGMLMQVTEVPYLWRRDKPDCLVWTQFPRCSILANISGTDIYKDRKDYLDIFEPEGVKIFRIPSPIFFGNIEFFKTKLVEALGFNPLRVLRKRNKALRSIRKLLRKGDMQWTTGMLTSPRDLTADSEDDGNKEDLDLPVDLHDLPIQIDWNRELPANITAPRVDLHSLILDFAAVSFLDISALKGLKTMLKELIRVDIEVYIVACDTYILEKLHACTFFDDEVRPSMFYLTLHDAMLTILEKHPEATDKSSHLEKVVTTATVHYPFSGSLRNRDKTTTEPETTF
ncbi:hypothetical protein NHX12_020547 [Muraenolepis orangiensis]|uniref:STAS domain-containing protein n=1 Tax=Muraenolepis orangiensis TaxID=630683 RepID=A0A9Q0EV27_9TELE|nr:hypothetical protein NHX12_020547 [Muraenolepis orangiensis]